MIIIVIISSSVNISIINIINQDIFAGSRFKLQAVRHPVVHQTGADFFSFFRRVKAFPPGPRVPAPPPVPLLTPLATHHSLPAAALPCPTCGSHTQAQGRTKTSLD